MKKKRTIILKTPSLIKIRNNLRSLILRVCSAVQLGIYDEIEKIKTPDYYKDPRPEIDEELLRMSDREAQIERSKRASILLCPACFKADRDMTYNPVLKEWYCTNCYPVLKKGFAEDGQPETFP